MRVCYFGTYRSEYIRNRLMIERLRMQGIEVVECHAPLWTGDEDREQAASGGWKRPAFLLRLVKAYLRLLQVYFQVGDYDILMTGYPGALDVLFARLLSWIRRRPLVWDIYMSITLIARERGLESRSQITVKVIQAVERLAVSLPDILIVDTQAYTRWYSAQYSIRPERIRLVPAGADDRVFHPLPTTVSCDNKFLCIYYGSFIHNHGVQYIVEAAHLLREEKEIHFKLIGRGPQRESIAKLAQEYALENITFIDWLNQAEIVNEMAAAQVCLGSFGATPQSLMTVHNKVFEGLAMAKTVITGDSPAIREILQHREHLYLCERENAYALAEAVRTLKANPELQKRLAQNGYCHYQEEFDLEHTSLRLFAHLDGLNGK
jgi:glycosyltransferase involved in cell wall biosynthesis